jgi:predicted dehydrogenase
VETESTPLAGTTTSVRGAEPALRMGILGAAAIAPAALVRPARSTPGVDVVAVAARDRRRADKFAAKHRIPNVHGSYDDLLADPDIDAVYVPLPNGLHGRWTIAALEAGKHVLCEKPLAANAVEAKRMADAAERSGLLLMEAFHWRYHPINVQLLDLVAGGAIGRVERIDAAFCFPLLGKPGDIRWRADLAGGALMDAGCYPINMVRAVAHSAGFDEPEVVGARIASTRAGRSRGVVDRAARGELRWQASNGAPVAGSVRCSMWGRDVLALSLDVHGDAGKLHVRNPLAPQLFGRLRGRTERGPVRERADRSVTTYGCQLRAFAAAVQRGEPFPTTADDGVRNMAVIDALYRAGGLEPHEPSA